MTTFPASTTLLTCWPAADIPCSRGLHGVHYIGIFINTTTKTWSCASTPRPQSITPSCSLLHPPQLPNSILTTFFLVPSFSYIILHIPISHLSFFCTVLHILALSTLLHPLIVASCLFHAPSCPFSVPCHLFLAHSNTPISFNISLVHLVVIEWIFYIYSNSLWL